jgi:putative transposase
MASTSEVGSVVRASSSNRVGGGEPAPPPGILTAMEVEPTDHLGYGPHREPPGGTGDTRNGSTGRRLATEHGPVEIHAPRDRDGSFEPKLVRKRQRQGSTTRSSRSIRVGLSTRDIEAHLEEIYGVKVACDLISRVTDAVMDDARAWQTRPLEDAYPVVYLDALVLKVRDPGSVQRRLDAGHDRAQADVASETS